MSVRTVIKIKRSTYSYKFHDCLYFQTNVRYNVNEPDTERQAFVTSVEIFNRPGEDRCKARSMKICTK